MGLLYCTILYYTVLYCTILYYTVLYCTCTVLYCTVLYRTVPYCTVLYCTVVLYCSVLYCVVLYCTVLYCNVLYRANTYKIFSKIPQVITDINDPKKFKKNPQKSQGPTQKHNKKIITNYDKIKMMTPHPKYNNYQNTNTYNNVVIYYQYTM